MLSVVKFFIEGFSYIILNIGKVIVVYIYFYWSKRVENIDINVVVICI